MQQNACNTSRWKRGIHANFGLLSSELYYKMLGKTYFSYMYTTASALSDGMNLSFAIDKEF